MSSRRHQDSDSAEEPGPSLLEDAVFALGRAYFNYVGLIERILREQKLEEVFAPGMGQIMFALFERDDRIIKEIAERVGLSQSTLTGMLARMEKAGLIERKRDAIDGRAIRVRLTSRGRDFEPQCRTVFDETRRYFRQALSEAELKTLREALAKLSVSFRAAVTEDRAPGA